MIQNHQSKVAFTNLSRHFYIHILSRVLESRPPEDCLSLKMKNLQLAILLVVYGAFLLSFGNAEGNFCNKIIDYSTMSQIQTHITVDII